MRNVAAGWNRRLEPSCFEEKILIKNFLKDDSGRALSEYAVAAALVALACVAAFQLLGTNISTVISNLAAKIK
jgi:Flp pilus assembly pilin Flp